MDRVRDSGHSNLTHETNFSSAKGNGEMHCQPQLVDAESDERNDHTDETNSYSSIMWAVIHPAEKRTHGNEFFRLVEYLFLIYIFTNGMLRSCLYSSL